MSKKWLYIIAAAVLVLAVAVAGTVYYMNSNNYVAKVGGEKVTKAEYNIILSMVKSQMLQTVKDPSNTEEVKEFWKTKIDGKSADEVAKDRALENIKEFKIQLIQARENKLALSKEESDGINNAVDSMIKQQGGRVAADEALKKEYGINVDQYRAFYKDYMLVSKFADEQRKKIEISDEQAKKYYETDKNKDNIDKVTVRHILFSTVDQDRNPLPEDKQKEAEKKANEMLIKVKSGGDMKELAKQFSEDPGVKENEGEYSFGINDQYVQEFKDWAFKAKVGDVGIVKTVFGYHVMKLEKKTDFDEAKDTVKSYVQAEEYNNKLEEWKKDPKYNVVKNQKVLDSIKIS